jgi:soluble cytochrome b562
LAEVREEIKKSQKIEITVEPEIEEYKEGMKIATPSGSERGSVKSD